MEACRLFRSFVSWDDERQPTRRTPIRIRLLGTAAGGGLPQWNCACTNCGLARQGKIRARTQSGVAISADGRSWWLVNASPDLRAQIESFPALQPSATSARNSPIAGVLLTNADLDHVLGLFLLREGGVLRVHAPSAIFATVRDDLQLIKILAPSCVLEHEEPPTRELALLPAAGDSKSGLRYRAIPLSSQPPPYATSSSAGTQSVAYEFEDERTGRRVVVAPDVAEITPELRSALERADAVLFDGTFWSEREYEQVTGRARTAADMGHLPIATGSLEFLRGLPARHKVYFHINNTNPILAPGSPERAAVENAGVTVGEDGVEFEL